MSRNLVLCADGTWNEPTEKDKGTVCPTNVFLTFQALDLATPTNQLDPLQLAYYSTGVGTQGGFFEHVVGGAFGYGIDQIIQDLYRWLIQNYEPGDNLYLFGFSRGAYTVRSLAGLIRNCGILTPAAAAKPGMIDYAYSLYRDRTDATRPGAVGPQQFRGSNSYPDFDLHFIGVWDTVGALGIPKGIPDLIPNHIESKLWEFHDVELSSHVRYAYQALATDERRKPFEPCVWTQQAGVQNQVLEQAWFPGVHCNVGGGYRDAGLSSGSLIWMWDRGEGAGLRLNRPAIGVVQNPNGELRDSMTPGYLLLGDGTRVLGTELPASLEGTASFTLLRSGYGPPNLNHFRQISNAVY